MRQPGDSLRMDLTLSINACRAKVVQFLDDRTKALSCMVDAQIEGLLRGDALEKVVRAEVEKVVRDEVTKAVASAIRSSLWNDDVQDALRRKIQAALEPEKS